jgi:hypothetical protein
MGATLSSMTARTLARMRTRRATSKAFPGGGIGLEGSLLELGSTRESQRRVEKEAGRQLLDAVVQRWQPRTPFQMIASAKLSSNAL